MSRILKFICIIIISIVLIFALSVGSIIIGFAACDNTRRDPFESSRVEAELSDKYGYSFSVLSTREESGDLYHTVSCEDYSSVTFTAHDMNDGIGGWTLSDDFPQVTLLYCAELNGLIADGQKNSFYCIISPSEDSTSQDTASQLMQMTDMFFSIYNCDTSLAERSVSFYLDSAGKVTIYDSDCDLPDQLEYSNGYKLYRNSSVQAWLTLAEKL